MKKACAEEHIDTQNTKSPKIQTYRYIYIQTKHSYLP